MLEITNQKGVLTELQCIIDLTNLGVRTLTPTDSASKYDVVADIEGKFIRIQCKTASWAKDTTNSNTAFFIRTVCSTTNTKQTTHYKYSANDIDYFYTYFEGQGYLISIQEASGKEFRMRYEYPSSGQRIGIHIADNYKIEEVIKSLSI